MVLGIILPTTSASYRKPPSERQLENSHVLNATHLRRAAVRPTASFVRHDIGERARVGEIKNGTAFRRRRQAEKF